MAGSEMEGAMGDLVKQYGFSPEHGHLTVFGTCADCAATKRLD